jgi:hypothetical protein
VEVDFPQRKPQSETVKAQNQKLSKKFKANGFPTFIVLDKDGNELGRQVGYLAGGPSAFISELKTFYKGSPNANATPAADSGSGLGALGGTAPSDDFQSLLHKPGQSVLPQAEKTP